MLPTGSSVNPGAESVGYSVPRSRPNGVRINVRLPLRNSDDLDRLIDQQNTKGSPFYHHWLTPAQFRAAYGPRFEDLKTVAAALQGAGFNTTFTSQGVIADAPQATVERTFNVHLQRVSSPTHGKVPTLAVDRVPTMPTPLQRLGAHLAGLASFQMKPQYLLKSKNPVPENRYSPTGGYWGDDLKQAYEYPSYNVLRGSGTKIAILAVSDFLDSDVALAFGHEKLTPPTIIRRPVDGGPQPFGGVNDGFSDEISLDVQEAGFSAPGSTLMVYGAPDASFEPSFLDMYTAVVEDNQADLVSASFGLCELFFTAPYNGGTDFTSILTSDFHDVFRQGNAQGITFLDSSGDAGALGCTDVAGAVATLGVEVFANDPTNVGVGGTNLVTSFIPGSKQSTYVRENAFSDPIDPAFGFPAGSIWGSGGGVSTIWKKPLYQHFVNTGASMRAVPDISLHMGGCPSTAVQPCAPDRSFDIVAVGGAFYGFIGTSASVQEFAGLQALQDQRLGVRTGNANYLIYGLAAGGSLGNGPIFHNDIPGNNGYPSHHGYNFVVGNGTVRGAQYAFDPFGPFAGTPQTPTNP